jgi:hypothetical protein
MTPGECSHKLVIASAAKQSRIFSTERVWIASSQELLAMTEYWEGAGVPYRQDNPASIVVQKPQCSGARKGAPAWAS